VKLLAVLLAAACSSPPPGSAAPPPASTPPDAGTALGAPPCPGRAEIGRGMVAERIALEGTRTCLTLVRIDLARYRLEVRTARADGGARPAPRWAADFGLVAAINTSMFDDDLRSVGMLYDARAVNRERDNPKQGGFFAFDPVDPRDPPVLVTGRGCDGFDLAAVRRRYRGLVQNYRLLDCDGRAIHWADPKIYSAALIAVDRDGRAVFAHARAPMTMSALSQVLAGLDLAGALFVEGGPEASLVAGVVEEIGSFETGFWDDSNHRFWDIPNVLGAARR